MAHLIHTGSLILLMLLLVVAATGDIRRFIIPNELCLAIAALSLPYWLSSGVPLWMLGTQAAFALLVFAIFAGVFALGVMGGGDVKLIGALALWLPWSAMMSLLFVMALVGGGVALATLIHHRMRKKTGQPEVPYGVAIAIAGLWVLGERYLNPFL